MNKLEELKRNVGTNTKSQTFLQLLVDNNGQMTTRELREEAANRTDTFLKNSETLRNNDINYRAKTKFSADPKQSVSNNLGVVTREKVEGRQSRLIIITDEWREVVEEYVSYLEHESTINMPDNADVSHLVDDLNDLQNRIASLEDQVDKTYEITQGLAENHGKHSQQIEDLQEEVEDAHERIEKFKKVVRKNMN